MFSFRKNQPDVSVIIATHNRAAGLRQTLELIRSQYVAGDTYEVVVVANGCVDDTERVLSAFSPTMSLTYLITPRAGKSIALNFGMRKANGRLLVFTDDDVNPSDNWLATYINSAKMQQKHVGFCGPILPVYPEHAPVWIRSHPFSVPGFAEFHLGTFEQDCAYLPFGPNFAVRSSAVGSIRFRTDLGCSEDNGPLSCEDVDFTQRFRNKNGAFRYLPNASVQHRIRDEQLNDGWLLERAFVLGKSMMAWMPLPNGCYPPLWELHAPGQRTAFDNALLVNYLLGQLMWSLATGRMTDGIMAPLKESLAEISDVDSVMLSQSATTFCIHMPERLRFGALERGLRDGSKRE